MKRARRDYRGKDGRKLPGVTTIIGRNLGWGKDALIGWAHKLGKEGRSMRERDEAASRGTATHALMEQILTGVAAEDVPAEAYADAMPLAQAAADVVRGLGDVMAVELALELDVAPLGYGGTIDVVVRRPDGALWVVDLKTGSGVYGEVHVQLGAYATLHHASGRGEIAGAAVVHAPWGGRSASVKVIDASALRDGAMVFAALLGIDAARERCNRRIA